MKMILIILLAILLSACNSEESSNSNTSTQSNPSNEGTGGTQTGGTQTGGTQTGGTQTGGTQTGGTQTGGTQTGGTQTGGTQTGGSTVELPPEITGLTFTRSDNSVKVSWKKSSNPAVKYSYKISSSLTEDQYEYKQTTETSFAAILTHMYVTSRSKRYVKVRSHLNGLTSKTYIDSFYQVPTTDLSLNWAWTDIAETNFVEKKLDAHTAVWTGTEMLVWGGRIFSTIYSKGAAYNPTTNSWRAISDINAPSPRFNHKAIWTGDRMLILGGKVNSETDSIGSSYDPATNSWKTISSVNAIHRSEHSATWTGSKVIVCGGKAFNDQHLTDCQTYNPITDQWTNFPTTNLSSIGHLAIWTGTTFLHWGGRTNETASKLGNMPNTNNQLTPRYNHLGVWTGNDLLIINGFQQHILRDGASYNPTTSRWTTLGLPPQHLAHFHSAQIWTGTEFIIWGGFNGSESSNGAAYNIQTKTWRTINSLSFTRDYNSFRKFSYIWTNKEMIIWGGIAAPGKKYFISNTSGFCGDKNQTCYGDSAEGTFSRLATNAITPTGRFLIYVVNPHGVYLWKDPESNRVLSPNGEDRWLSDNNGIELKDFDKIKNRVCTSNSCSYTY